MRSSLPPTGLFPAKYSPSFCPKQSKFTQVREILMLLHGDSYIFHCAREDSLIPSLQSKINCTLFKPACPSSNPQDASCSSCCLYAAWHKKRWHPVSWAHLLLPSETQTSHRAFFYSLEISHLLLYRIYRPRLITQSYFLSKKKAKFPLNGSRLQ